VRTLTVRIYRCRALTWINRRQSLLRLADLFESSPIEQFNPVRIWN